MGWADKWVVKELSPAGDETVIIVNLDEPDRRLSGRITNVSRHGFGLMMDQPLPAGCTVRVDFEGNMLLAEVCYCRKRRDGSGYAVGLRAEHVLNGTEDLEKLVQAIMGSRPQDRVPH